MDKTNGSTATVPGQSAGAARGGGGASTSPELFACVLRLAVLEPGEVPAASGRPAHAAFLDLIRQVEPAAAIALHDANHDKPFTVSPLRLLPAGDRAAAPLLNSGPLVLAGARAELRFTLSDAALFQMLLRRFVRLSDQPRLRLGTAVFAVVELVTTAEDSPWAGTTSFAALAGTPACSALTLEFASPTAFSRGQGPGGKRFELFPTPEAVFWSLLKLWNTRAPRQLQLPRDLREAVTEHVQVLDYRLATATLAFDRYVQRGFLGRCSYDLGRGLGAEGRQALAALGAFALYAGCGYKTTMGMGQVRVLGRPAPVVMPA